MYRLVLLGGLEIKASGGPPPERAAQPRQLALLALLTASDGPATRDKVVGRLWAEEGDRRARRRLSDTLYVLRQELGSDAVVAVGDTLALNPDVVGSDLADFEDSLDAGDLAEAVDLYGGPFLDGFYLTGSAAFERWVSGERRRIARSYRVALETLARSAADRGDLREAVRWRRRRVSEMPYSTLAVRQLMEVLVAVGDQAAALQAARAHEQLVRSELDGSPDADFVEFVEKLRAGGRAAASTGLPDSTGLSPATEQETSGVTGVPRARGAPVPPAERSPGETSSEPRGHWRHAPKVLLAGGLGLVLIALAAITWLVVGSGGGDAFVGRDPPSIAVLPWKVRGEARDLEYLEEGLVDLLSLSVDEMRGIRSVDPYGVVSFVERSCGDPIDPQCGSRAAALFDADRFLTGTVVPQPNETFELWASLYDAEGARLRRTTVRGDSRDPVPAVREVTRRLGIWPSTASLSGGEATRSASVLRRWTASTAALRRFLEARAELRASRPDEAIGALREAVALDSGFALAWYELAVIAERLGGKPAWELADSAARHARRGVERLPDRQRRVLQALDLLQRAEPSRAEDRFRDVLDAYPHEFAAWHLLGELRHHYNVVRGKPPDGKPAFRRLRELDPHFRPALWHLRLEALADGRIADFDSLTRAFLSAADARAATRPPGEMGDRGVRTMETRYARLARADHLLVGLLQAEDDSARERWFAGLERVDGDALAWMAGLHFEHLSWPDRRRDARRMARLLTRPSRSPSERARGFLILGSIALRAGRWSDATAALDSLGTLDPWQAALWRADWASTSFVRLPTETLSEIRAEAAQVLADTSRIRPIGLPLGAAGWTTTPPPDARGWGWSRLALLSMRLGQRDEAHAYAARLAATSPLGRELQLVLRTENHTERGDLDAARATLDSVRYGVRWHRLTASVHPQLFLRAELLHALGELEEARAWYELWTHLTGPRYLGPALRRLGQIHEALGEPELAISRYGEFVSLWDAADPELQPWVGEARARIAALKSPGGPVPGSNRRGGRPERVQGDSGPP